MEKKKIRPILTIICSVAVLAACLGPFLSLTPGSFFYAVLGDVNAFLMKWVGFFNDLTLSKFSLLPLAALAVLLSINAICHRKIVFSLLYVLTFVSLLLVFSYSQGTEGFAFASLLPKGYQIPAIAVLALSCLCIVLLRIKKKVVKKEPKEEPKPEPAKAEQKKVPEEKNPMDTIRSTVVPEFKSFKNMPLTATVGEIKASVSQNAYAVANAEQKIREEARKQREADELEKKRKKAIFKPKTLLRKIAEDAKAEKDFPVFDIPEVTEKEPIPEVKQPIPEVKQPILEVKQPQPMAEVVQPAEEDDPEEAEQKYMSMKEEIPQKGKKSEPDIDFVSGVGGLASASGEKSYLLDKGRYDYKFPPESLLRHYEKRSPVFASNEDDPNAQTIVETLREFKVDTELLDIQHGPTFTLYELSLAKGVRVNAVLNLADNIAMELAVSENVRILAPIPGKAAIGVEVPNKKRDTIGFDEMLPALKAREFRIPMVLGKTITGDSIVIDLAGAPHLLIAGTTGSGKSVCVNSLICSVLYTKTPKEVRMILVDPKMVELSVYNDIPHLLTPVITEAKKALKAMAFCVEEMERRMKMFKSIGARKIEDYNEKIVEKSLARVKLPFIMVIIDEFADLMSVVGKELESYIKRISAMARFTGIHLVLATQRPSADVITGIIKSNIPTQIAFAVSNSVNSRIILDSQGAEKLLGKGDMLYSSSTSRTPVRIQGSYIDPEIEEIVGFVKSQGEPDYLDEVFFEDDEEESEELEDEESSSNGQEDMFTTAWKLVADRGEASASYLQRRMSIGYNRAANLIEQLEEAGCIGPARGSKAREIYRYPGVDK